MKQSKPKELCQACKDHVHMYVLKDAYGQDKDFLVCANCLFILVNCGLTKEQYRNLIKSGHSVDEFLLHGDFYDEDGTALQPAFSR